jgi:hypothetical protein
MDWHLFNPIFNMNLKDLYNAKLQKKIIHKFCPQLNDIPINSLDNKTKIYNLKNRFKQKISRIPILKKFLLDTYNLIKFNNRKKSLESFYRTYNRDKFNNKILEELDIDFLKLENKGEVDMISRLSTIIDLYEYLSDDNK